MGVAFLWGFARCQTMAARVLQRDPTSFLIWRPGLRHDPGNVQGGYMT
jgi:hypothetical protein